MVEVATSGGTHRIRSGRGARGATLFDSNFLDRRRASIATRRRRRNSVAQVADSPDVRARRRDRPGVARRLRRTLRISRHRRGQSRLATDAVVAEVMQVGSCAGAAARDFRPASSGRRRRRVGDSEVRRLQRGRRRLRHILRPHDHGRRSVRADRGDDDRGARRRARRKVTSTCDPSIRTRVARSAKRSRRRIRTATSARTCSAPGKRFELEDTAGRGRVHLRRGNGDARKSSRAGAGWCASSRRCRRWKACSASRRSSTT